MKVKRTSSVLAALAFSHQVSVPVHAKKDSTKGLDSHSTKNDSNSVTAPESSLFDDLFGQPIPSNAIDSTSVVVPDPSSSLRRRDLKKDSSKYFFFEDCSDTCAENDGVATSLDDGCCAGGVSFLKVKFQAQDQIRGTITLGSAHSLSCEGPSSKPSSKGTWGHKGSKGGVIPKPSKPSQSPSNYELRIVDCDAACIQDPFGGKTCKEDPTLAKKDVVSGSEICFAMIKSESDGSYKVAFDEKMPTDIYVLFLSSEGFSVGAIHTSCSVPLSQSWGVRLEDPCNDSPSYTSYKTTKAREKHFNIRDNKSVGTPYLSFVDGISTKYYNAVEHIRKEPDTSSYLRDFSIRFKNCGCTCENFNKTPGIDPNVTPIPIQNVTPSPISSPTYIPSLVPTELPIADPTSSPTTKPTPPSTANPTHSPTNNPSPYPTEHTTSFTTYATSSSTTTTGPTIVSDPDGGKFIIDSFYHHFVTQLINASNRILLRHKVLALQRVLFAVRLALRLFRSIVYLLALTSPAIFFPKFLH